MTWTQSHLSIGVRVAIRYTNNRSNPPVRYGTIQKHALESAEDEFDDLFEILLDEGGTLLMGCIEVNAAMELYTKYQKNDVFLAASGPGKGLARFTKSDPFLEEYLCTVVSDGISSYYYVVFTTHCPNTPSHPHLINTFGITPTVTH